jgi:hypothetical protein
LQANFSGNQNTALGHLTLNNSDADFNTAVGDSALFSNLSGEANIGIGVQALYNEEFGNNNIAIGNSALNTVLSGNDNLAIGHLTLYTATGSGNIGIGDEALGVQSGDGNIAIGIQAGLGLTNGSNNIYIGGDVAGIPLDGKPIIESSAIRIGNETNATASNVTIKGIYGGGVNGNGVNVMVDDTGKLGVGLSSARYKEDIHSMGNSTVGLMKLRPVRFHYKNDESGLEQYGLIAEEVARVYPEMVMYDDKGQPKAVRYQFLAPMLLNELQKQARRIEEQSRQVVEQSKEIEALTARLVQVEAVLGDKLQPPALQAHYETTQCASTPLEVTRQCREVYRRTGTPGASDRCGDVHLGKMSLPHFRNA